MLNADHAAEILDPNTADVSLHPLWALCPRYEVQLEPGDLLLNPPWW